MSGHDHSHALPAAGRRGRLAVVFSITATIMVAEVIGALASGSLALLADAGHMFTDSAGLLIALTAATLALRPATDKRTWGYKRAEIIALPLVAVERIEVLKGPASALYGSEGVAGVVQVFTRKGRDGWHPHAALSVGSERHCSSPANTSA